MKQFYSARADKKLYFTDKDQKIATGLSEAEFEDMASYLVPFKGQFRRFDYKEALNILLIHIRKVLNIFRRFSYGIILLSNTLRHAEKYEFLKLIVRKMTDRELTDDAFSLLIRRVLFILVGKNRWGYNETYHKRVSKNIYGNVGLYYVKYVNLNQSNYKKFLKDGASVFTKGLAMDLFALQDLISYCEDEDTTNEEIKEHCDTNLELTDLFVCIDGTYVSHFII